MHLRHDGSREISTSEDETGNNAVAFHAGFTGTCHLRGLNEKAVAPCNGHI